jgi:zinc-finger of transposase IS204/IS1001/IS1096/IS1165
MRKNMDWAPGPGVRIVGVERGGDCWVISAAGPEVGFCPVCHEPSTRRHSRYFRHLQDLPVQGAAVMVKVQVSRWRCLNRECERRTFTDQLPDIVCPHARRTQRIAELVHLFGHGTGGRPGERLMKRLGMPVSDDTILRHLKRQVARLHAKTTYGWRASTTGVGERVALMGLSSSTWSGARLSMCSRIARPPGQPNGLASILRSKSSAATAVVSMHTAHARVRRRRGRSLTASISCRTCAKRSRRS